jgi:hypothetical protein
VQIDQKINAQNTLNAGVVAGYHPEHELEEVGFCSELLLS